MVCVGAVGPVLNYLLQRPCRRQFRPIDPVLLAQKVSSHC